MRRRVTRQEVAEAIRLAGGSSPPGNWWVCEEYEIQGDEIVSGYPAPMFVMRDGSADFELLDHWRRYDPLEEAPDLFLKIASLYDEPDFPAAALAFCHKYGVPGGSSAEEEGRPDKISVRTFLAESKRARDILRIYEATINEDFDVMVALLSDPEILPDTWKGKDRHARALARPPSVDHLSKTSRGRGVVRLTALLLAASSVDHTVRNLCHLGTSLKVGKWLLEHPPTLASRWDFDNLLGAAYLQMHWLITSGDDLARCENCGRVLSLTRPHPQGRKRRRDKRFCDDACRQAHHRSKKKT